MLFIKTKTRKLEWHVGEPLPDLHLGSQGPFDESDGAVINFQADGHELDWLLTQFHRTQDAERMVEMVGRYATGGCATQDELKHVKGWWERVCPRLLREVGR